MTCPATSVSMLFSALALIATSSLASQDVGVQDDLLLNEVVMVPGMSITLENDIGTLTVKARNGQQRVYKWEGFSRAVKLGVRKKRWHGSLGLFFPGAGEHWQDAGGVRRLVAEEGWRHFADSSEALAWIEKRNAAENRYNKTAGVKYFAYSNDGLVVSWSKTLGRKQLNVEIWQMVIAGKKPKQLAGSNDEAITVGFQQLDAKD